uniref:Uncharacterized protein n=1 Tax=Marseillevirus LCMAC103 TaxID=2506604 RepID=A0A481YVK3_9VIRU|nr:MAG: hypothetical protein LCMAC103_02710 [Marseillevirus LCMAC103]
MARRIYLAPPEKAENAEWLRHRQVSHVFSYDREPTDDSLSASAAEIAKVVDGGGRALVCSRGTSETALTHVAHYLSQSRGWTDDYSRGYIRSALPFGKLN